MARRYDEEGVVWLLDHGWLTDDEIALCERADTVESLRSPVPTQVISNGEYMPPPQNEQQKKVEARVQELADAASRKLGVDRRSFLRSTGGTAAAFLAMNEVFGRFFHVDPIEMFEPSVYAQASTPRQLFVFDDQLHMVRGSDAGPLIFRAMAQGPSAAAYGYKNPMNPTSAPDETGEVWPVWNPALVGLPVGPSCYHIVQFIKDVYLDSQVTVGLLSNAPAAVILNRGEEPRPPRTIEESQKHCMLTTGMTAAARDFINQISGSTRMLAHGMLYPGKGNLWFMEEQVEKNQPDSWKGYNVANSAKIDEDPESAMRMWRHDDEEVAYPTFEFIAKTYERLKARKPGLNNVCVHMMAGEPAHPRTLPKALKDWPTLNFVTFHACIDTDGYSGPLLKAVQSGQTREGVPDIPNLTEYAQLVAPFKNCYAEIGSTWASVVISFPTVAAHLMGQLMKYLGPDRIIFGSDSVWYGSPQWQIDALWRFQIPAELRKKYGYPELTPEAKRKILGLNSARMYGLKVATGAEKDKIYRPVPRDYELRMTKEFKAIMELDQTADNLAKIREQYLAMGPTPSLARYGWIRRSA